MKDPAHHRLHLQKKIVKETQEELSQSVKPLKFRKDHDHPYWDVPDPKAHAKKHENEEKRDLLREKRKATPHIERKDERIK